MVKVEKGIPVPEHGNKGKGKCKWPWRQMEVGDSFLFSTDRGRRLSAGSQAKHAGVRYGMKFTCRATDEGIRIWRTA